MRQGIGIHCGNVIAGNLGSRERLEYTVIGAALNLVSRLESLTRQLPEYLILISGEVRDLIADLVVVDELGLHAVKGWPQPVAVYGLVGLHPHRPVFSDRQLISLLQRLSSVPGHTP